MPQQLSAHMLSYMQGHSLDTAPKGGVQHPTWYQQDGSDIFLVEGTLFKVACNILVMHSQVFADMFSMPQNKESTECLDSFLGEQGTTTSTFLEGKSDLNLIHLPQVTAMEFEYMVDSMYNSQWKMPPFPFEQLVAMLKLSSIYLMVPAHEWAIHWLSSENLHPAVRIELAHFYNVPQWIEPAFRTLLSCKLTTLTIKDTFCLGLRTFAALAKTREVIQELHMAVAYSTSQMYGLAAECPTPDECRTQWISWFWMNGGGEYCAKLNPETVGDPKDKWLDKDLILLLSYGSERVNECFYCH
ncbi:hypothetical protein K439DRAFT_1623365 [Ramaria rubella]|nr:hypothetical protein K439DRAFT_1623365 [Ramaria rubella]